MSAKSHNKHSLQALTANDLRYGHNLWLTADLTWSDDFSKALITKDAQQCAAMEKQGAADDAANKVIGVYFIDIDPESLLPIRYREKFRVQGPSWDMAEHGLRQVYHS